MLAALPPHYGPGRLSLEGERAVTEPFVVEAGGGQALWYAGGLVEVLTMPAENAGNWGISIETYPPGFSTSLHRHLRDDGAFYLLEGSMRVKAGDIERLAHAGDLVFLPKDVPHAFRVEGDGPARWLSIQSPSGDFMRVAMAEGVPAESLTLPTKPLPEQPPMADSGIERVGPSPFAESAG